MSELDTAIRQFRRLRAEREASTARALQQAFLTARNSLQAQLDSMAAWADLNPDPPLWRVLAEARTRNLLEQADRLFAQYSRQVGTTVIREQQQAVAQAQTEARQLIEHGFGPPPAGVGMPFVRIPQQAITQLVATMQPGAPVRKLLDEFGGDAAKIVENELISGVAMGRSLRQTAAAISEAVGGHYDRAFLITRTETLRAYRGAQQEVYKQNAHLLEGWIWHASLTTRTCASCWAMHGTLHKVTESMSEHPAGRCSMVPRTKSWRDLGYDVPDERPDIEPGVDVFNRLNPEQQQKILTPKAYKAFRDGSIELRDLVNVRQSKTWGTTRSAGSADGALSRAAKRVEAIPAPSAFRSATSLQGARDFSRSLGVRSFSGDSNSLNVWNQVNRALARVKSQGFEMPSILRIADFGSNARAIANYSYGATDMLGINSGHKYWRNPKLEARKQFEAHQLATDDPLGVIYHEIGHREHFMELGLDQFREVKNQTLTDAEGIKIRKDVSWYATKNPTEFVAEVFHGMMAGKHYDAEIMRLYKKFDGPTSRQSAREQSAA